MSRPAGAQAEHQQGWAHQQCGLQASGRQPDWESAELQQAQARDAQVWSLGAPERRRAAPG